MTVKTHIKPCPTGDNSRSEVTQDFYLFYCTVEQRVCLLNLYMSSAWEKKILEDWGQNLK